jgi:hypothetical protein
VSFFRQPRFWVIVGLAAVAVLILDQFWHWEVCRVEVPPGKFLVRIHRWGKDLAPDQILAPDESYKGVMLQLLPEGRHFLNPLFWSYEVHDMVNVPPGRCLVVTRKFGKPLSQERLAAGDILVSDDDGTCGIEARVRTPGSYRLNPYAYTWSSVEAVEVGAGQVGVRTLKAGKDPRELPADERRGRYVMPTGYRGVQAAPVRPGTYYVNPYAEIITPVDVQVHRVELTDAAFPSRDGFILKPHIIVAYAVTPEKAPEMLARLSDEGRLHQEDQTEEQKRQNEILQKIILPHVRGYARIEGSNLDAKDFIITDSAGGAAGPRGREQFQQALSAKVTPQCEELGLDIEAVTLGSLDIPPDLAEQISARDVARATLDKNKTKVEQYKTEQELQAAKALAQQATEKVTAETRLSQAKTLATTKKENEKTRLETDLANAQLKLDAAREQAKAVLARGKAEADIINFNNEAEVAGLRKAVQGFAGVQNFAQFHIMEKLAPALSEIFASDDSDFARLFAAYMTQSGNGNPRPAPARTAEPPPMPMAPMGQ